MYIDKIDDLIDRIIDDFYITVILTDKNLNKIYDEVNFVKYQKIINDIISTYSKEMNLSEIKELVKNNDALNTIFETIKRYISFYFFLTIGFNYKSKEDTYINNIVEFTKNQSEFNFKIDNFFNSNSNSLIIKYNKIIHNILNLLSVDKAKLEILKKKSDYIETIKFLNEIGSDYIQKNFVLNNIENTKEATNKQTQCHNIIKTIIILLLYKIGEKNEFFKILELTEQLDGEYMFIDIVVPTRKYIDFNTLDKLIGSTSTINKYLSHNLWKFMNEYENELIKPLENIEDKINLLLNAGIVYPISDDFLLYHKESEKYDRNDRNDDQIIPNIKKKEDTKIRYITNKIDTTTDYYSEQAIRDVKIKNKIRKNFYLPLANRKVVLVNDHEDIQIINKLKNQNNISSENINYLNDLLIYKLCPYINFKDYEKYGCNITLNKTIDVIRNVSVTRTGEFKQNIKNVLQLRTGSKNSSINIIGLMIPTNKLPIKCVKTQNTKNIKDYFEKSKNGLKLFTKYLDESTLGSVPHNSSVYWMFDLNTDKINMKNEEYEQIGNFTQSDQIKYIIGTLYDNMIFELYNIIINKIENTKKMTLQKATKIINFFEKKLLKFTPNSDTYIKLQDKIYELIETFVPTYDKSDDLINGMTDDSINLPEYPKEEEQKIQKINIDLTDLNEYGIIEDKEIVDGICQHNISWDKIASMKKVDPKVYIDLLSDFIEQYIIENINHDYVCKSCGFLINIKNYIVDGQYDDTTQRFIAYGHKFDMELAEIQEYTKYKHAIDSTDKTIEKIGMISNLQHLTKLSENSRSRRKLIIKDLIDLIVLNNKKLKEINLNTRKELANKNYGVNKDLSDLFVFEFENAIFVYSSKDKDFYKQLKRNNHLAYLLYLILLETTESHILYIGLEKKGFCNIHVFDKIYYNLFEGLKIRINNNGTTINITDYKLLCYVLYIFACCFTKYNMWAYEYPDETKKKNYIVTIQKKIIHTVIDIINNVLENAANNKTKDYIYNMISIKTFKKFDSIYKNNEIYDKILNDGKTSIHGEKKSYIITKKNIIPLTGKYELTQYEIPERVICRVPRYYILSKIINLNKYYHISNITNCKDGKFHEWKNVSGKLKCKLCNIISLENKEDNLLSKTIMDGFNLLRLRNLANKICYIDGLIHQYVRTENNSNCTKCGNNIKHIYTNDELIKLEKSIEKFKNKEAHNMIDNQKIKDVETLKETTYVEKVVISITKIYNESTKIPFDFINNFIDDIQSIIGNDNSEFNLVENMYIIDHDHMGNLIDKKIVLVGDNKILYKENHQFFNTNVIYYINSKNGKIEIFYDAITKHLLGYKEQNKQYILNNETDKKIIINYSILSKLKLLGNKSHYINIDTEFNNLILDDITIEKLNKQKIYDSVIYEITRLRILNLKNTITNFQRFIQRIMNNYSEQKYDEEQMYFRNKFNLLIEKHRKKMQGIKITNENNKHQIFKHWKAVKNGIFVESLDFNYEYNKNIIINIEELNSIDKSGNIILFYILSEFSKLLKYNNQKTIKIVISNFLIDFINMSFDLFNEEKLFDNIEIKRFNYIILSKNYLEVIESYGADNIQGIYGEYSDPAQELTEDEIEAKIDKDEEQDALDVDYQMNGEDADYPFENGQDMADQWTDRF
jgi:hypothetical protein